VYDTYRRTQLYIVMCNTQNSLLLNQHNGDDAPQNFPKNLVTVSLIFTRIGQIKAELINADGQDMRENVYRRFAVFGGILIIKAT